MAVYSITDIAALTGIKPHTLRTWEKRYGLDISRRSDTNVRYYLDEDLRRIINISILNKAGMKISKIARLTWSEMRRMVAEAVDVHLSHETDLDSLSLSVINLDQISFDKIIRINVDQNGFKWTLDNLIFPLFEKMNSMYLTGTIKPVHESFFNYMLKGKIMTQIDQLRSSLSVADPDYILFQPQGSGEELGLMLLNYFLLADGNLTLNLGSHINPNDIIQAYQLYPSKYIVGLFNAQMKKDQIETFIDQVQEHCPKSELILSGFDVYQAQIKGGEKLRVLPDLQAITSYLTHHRNGVEATTVK